MLYTDADTLAYLRDTADEQIIVVGYRGAAKRAAGRLPVRHGAVADGTQFTELLTGVTATVSAGELPLPDMRQGPAIWRADTTT